MRWTIPILPLVPLVLAGCGDERSAEERAAADARAVAEVEASQVPPPQAFSPQPILYPDIEKHRLYGAGCSFAPEGGGLGAVALAMADQGFMKRDGALMRFAADKGSAELPYLARSEYDGKVYSFTLDLDRESGERSGMETSDFDAALTVRDAKGRVVYDAPGIAQCGA